MSKLISTKEEIDQLFPIFNNFPIFHNTLKGDVQVLVDGLEVNITNQKAGESYYRSIVNSFFNLVEADLYYYNQFDAYKNYNDHHNFGQKFRKTFKQICSTWDKDDLRKEYFKIENGIIFKLRKIRNGLNHPKNIGDLFVPNSDDVKTLLSCCSRYFLFVSEIMKNFFVDIRGTSTLETIELGNYVLSLQTQAQKISQT